MVRILSSHVLWTIIKFRKTCYRPWGVIKHGEDDANKHSHSFRYEYSHMSRKKFPSCSSTMWMRWADHVARMGEGRNVYRVLVGKPEGNRPLERLRNKWEDGIKKDIRLTGWSGCGVDSPASGYGSLAGCCRCGDEPSGSGATELVRSTL
jgi:hypothetical protein